MFFSLRINLLGANDASPLRGVNREVAPRAFVCIALTFALFTSDLLILCSLNSSFHPMQSPCSGALNTVTLFFCLCAAENSLLLVPAASQEALIALARLSNYCLASSSGVAELGAQALSYRASTMLAVPHELEASMFMTRSSVQRYPLCPIRRQPINSATSGKRCCECGPSSADLCFYPFSVSVTG